MNLLSSSILQILHTQLMWLGFTSMPSLLILKWDASMSCQPETLLEQASAYTMCFGEAYWLLHSPFCPKKSQGP